MRQGRRSGRALARPFFGAGPGWLRKMRLMRGGCTTDARGADGLFTFGKGLRGRAGGFSRRARVLRGGFWASAARGACPEGQRGDCANHALVMQFGRSWRWAARESGGGGPVRRSLGFGLG